jgi:hypothetical protein
MTGQEHKDVYSYRVWVHREFGIEYSSTDPIIPTMYVFHKEMQLTVETIRGIADEIKENTSRVNPVVYNFNDKGESLKFQLGIFLKWALFSLPVSLVIWIASLWWSSVNDVDKARMIIDSSENIRVLANRIQKSPDGFYFIDFAPTRGDSTKPFTEFKLIDKRTVRVFIGKDPIQKK